MISIADCIIEETRNIDRHYKDTPSLGEAYFCNILRPDVPGFARKQTKKGLFGWIFIIDNY